MVNVRISPDEIIYLKWGLVHLNATIVCTWIVMALLIGISLFSARRVRGGVKIGKLQNFMEWIVEAISDQIQEMMERDPRPYLPFIGTLFLFILLSNVLSVFPFFESPTGSISTTAALAVTVFFAVPVFGIVEKGVKGYFKHYIEPTPVMLPFNIISELSRTLALAVRLFGNIMSGSMIVGVLLSIAPLFIPVIMQALGLIIGVIQAYIFAALATVYIASAVKIQEEEGKKKKREANTRRAEEE